MQGEAFNGRRTRRFGVLLAVALMIGLPACGGGDDDGAVGGDGDTTTTAAAAGDDAAHGDSITIDNFAFSPSELEVESGTTVEVTNDDSAAHTWTSDDDAWDSGTLSPGDSFSHDFDEAGTYTFHCALHSSMTGTVTVTG